MIKLNEQVTHNGKTYEAGEQLNDVNKKQAQRLVDLGVAFFMGEVSKEPPKNPEHDQEVLKEELDTIEYGDLKEVAKAVELEFPGNISKAKLIDLIISNDKADEVLAFTEEEE
ncbi:hypothetical protein [Virgibacillus halodenitrificans]|uniref:DUF7210 family protein n=1 Tax=Virgibacillus halodenitrificans TaxID=1482 RepID=UPI000EF4D8A8|nr:hypothetical protein [Virgibacillus halodenitrificans]